jgi:anti-sigma factor RsiW
MKKDPLQNELRALLSRLPDAPVASNFTARVLQAVELEDARRPRPWHFNWHSLLPRVAFALAVVLFAGLTFQRHELIARRVALAQSVALVASSSSLPDLDALKNFDAIQRMSQSAPADEEILAMQP